MQHRGEKNAVPFKMDPGAGTNVSSWAVVSSLNAKMNPTNTQRLQQNENQKIGRDTLSVLHQNQDQLIQFEVVD